MFSVRAKETRARNRRIDTTVTLSALASLRTSMYLSPITTYKAPTLNINSTPIFFLVLSCRFQIQHYADPSMRERERVVISAMTLMFAV
jgi:hypothetical protein